MRFPHHLERLPSERVVQRDPLSGLDVVRLTAACGHSHALYFTEDSWTADGRHLVLASERGGSNELWLCDLGDGSLFRLTDGGKGAAEGNTHQLAALYPGSNELACWQGAELTVLSLASGGRRAVFDAGERMRHGLSWSADGRWILTCVSETAGVGSPSSTEQRLEWRKRPQLSQVIAVAADGSGFRVLHEERRLITHVNASPADAGLCTFCHEGPWLEVDQRIWGLRLDGGAPWKIVPRDPEWGVGHEYWLGDGRTVGYHARHAGDPWRHAAGFADALTGEVWQAELSLPTHHAVAVNREFVVLDGTRATGDYLLVVDREGDGWGAPRILACHDSSRHHHRAHVHARVRRDGRQVLFTSDRRSYCDVYLLDLPDDRSTLPVWPGKPYRYYWE